MKKIIITGCPRTGTTALANLLTHSSNVFMTNELATFHRNKEIIQEKIDNLDAINTRALELKGWNKNNLQNFIEDKFYDPRIELCGDKHPDYCINPHIISYILENYSDCYFIFTNRNPCATAYSFLKRSKEENNPKAAWYAKNSHQALDSIIKYTLNWSTLYYPNVTKKIIINYEDYINNSTKLIEKLNYFLNTKLDIFEPEKLYFHTNPNEYLKLSPWERKTMLTKYQPIQNHIDSL